MKRLVAIATAVLVLSIGWVAAVSAMELGTVASPNVGVEASLGQCLICDLDTSGYAGPLSEQEIEGLLLALNDEYKAWAVYDQVVQDFGQVRPFSNIRGSEANHIQSLVGLFEAYGLPVPENSWPGQVPSFDSVKAAAQGGVQAEVDNVDLYDRLFGSTEREDILAVYRSLQRASVQNHLPAFQRAAGR